MPNDNQPTRRQFNAAAVSAIGAAAVATSPVWSQSTMPAAAASITVRADSPKHPISRHLYGHFAEHLGRCIYEGIWVGEDSSIANTRGIRNDVVAALKKLNIPNLRWPGGCFADEYHWKDGIGPREKRPKLINTHWGGVVENNHFGTHEFLDLCEQLGTEPYICGNVGSGSVQEMMEWMEYLTSDADSPMANLRRQNGREQPWTVKYFGVGNESWGCGGNMTPEYYSNEFRRYNTFVKNYGSNKVYRIACGSNGEDFNWTEVLMKNVGPRRMNGLSLHYYTLPTGDWKKKGSATQFDEKEYHATLARTLHMEELVQKHAAIMDKHDPEKRVGMIIDEWGTWYDVEPGTNPGFLHQQNTMRDALVAGVNFHIFHKHADRIAMTNIAQTVNVLQAMILTDKEKMVLTPTYHVFEMFKVHMDAKHVPVEIESPKYEMNGKSIPQISAGASVRDDGRMHVSLCNLHHEQPATVKCALRGAKSSSKITGRILTTPAINTFNNFDAPDRAKPAAFDSAKQSGDALTIDLPAKSVVVLEIA
jgi:alpha-L-arabinofuranosidase